MQEEKDANKVAEFIKLPLEKNGKLLIIFFGELVPTSHMIKKEIKLEIVAIARRINFVCIPKNLNDAENVQEVALTIAIAEKEKNIVLQKDAMVLAHRFANTQNNGHNAKIAAHIVSVNMATFMKYAEHVNF
jgi:hypothetical protein